VPLGFGPFLSPGKWVGTRLDRVGKFADDAHEPVL